MTTMVKKGPDILYKPTWECVVLIPPNKPGGAYKSFGKFYYNSALHLYYLS